MLISVVVPLYNKGEYVVRALESIRRQTHTDLEVIVVDDGSTDDGPELVRRVPDPRIRVLCQPNAGPGAARNRGLTEACGELVAFLDADDAWLPDYLLNAASELVRLGDDVVAVTSGYIDWPQGISREPLWRRRGLTEGIQRVSPSISADMLVHMLAYMSPCSTVARAAAIRRWGGFYHRDGCRFGEDAVLWLKVLLNERVYFQLRPLAHFHREASSLSSNYAGPRPVEPFLLEPAEVAAVCPRDLLPLLHRFYAARACKTASMLGFWGDWRAARQLLSRFVTLRDWRTPFFLPAHLAATPAGKAILRVMLAGRTAFFRNHPLASIRT